MAYSPASNTTQTPTISHVATIYYAKEGLDVLRQMNRFYSVCEPDDIPQRTGRQIQWFRYSTFAANTTPSAEGVVGTGLSLTTNTVTATVAQYSDFLSISTMLKATAIDDITANAAKEISYRGAITVDTLCRIEFDSNAGASLATSSSYFTAADAKNAVARLKGLNVKPRNDGNFWGIIHPYISYDLTSDNTAGGFIDVMKYADPQRMVAGEVGKIAGVRFLESTNVGTSGSAPTVQYKTYIVGLGGVGAVSLVGYGPNNVIDPSKSTFKVNIIDGGPGPSDPEGQIAKFISYFFIFVAKTLDSTNLRYRFVPSDASIV